jgi:hypothetical protein
LPPLLRTLIGYLNVFQFEGATLHPACLDGAPFQQQYIQMGLVLGLELALVALLINYRRLCGCVVCGVGRHHQLLGSKRAAAAGGEGSSAGEPRASVVAASPLAALPGRRRRSDARRHQRLNEEGEASTGTARGASSLRARPARSCTRRCGENVDRLKPSLRKLVLTLLTLLYALVCNSVLGLLPCNTVIMPARSYKQLAGDGTTLARYPGATDDTPVAVALLASNPFFVCYEGSHTIAAYTAWATLAAFALGYPLLSYAYAARRLQQVMERGPAGLQWLAARAGDEDRRAAYVRAARNPVVAAARWLAVQLCGAGATYGLPERPGKLNALHVLAKVGAEGAPASAATVTGSPVAADVPRVLAVRRLSARGVPGTPMSAAGRSSVTALSVATATSHASADNGVAKPQGLTTAAAGTADDVVDALPAVTANASLAHFTAGDYRASAFYFRHLDVANLLALSALLTVWDTPASTAASLGKLGVTVAALGVLAALVAGRRPYRPHESWKGPVRVYSLLLSCLSAGLNCAHYIDTMRQAEAAAAAPAGTASGYTTSSGSVVGGSGGDGAVTGDTAAPAEAAQPSLLVLVLSYATFACSIGLLVTLLAAFFATLLRGARREKVEDEVRVRTRLRARRAMVPTGRPLGGPAPHGEPGLASPARAASSALGDEEDSKEGAASEAGQVRALAGPITTRRAVLRLDTDDDNSDTFITNPLARPRQPGGVAASQSGGGTLDSTAARLAGYASRRPGALGLSAGVGASGSRRAGGGAGRGVASGGDDLAGKGDDEPVPPGGALPASTAQRPGVPARAMRASLAPVAFGVAQISNQAGGAGRPAGPRALPQARVGGSLSPAGQARSPVATAATAAMAAQFMSAAAGAAMRKSPPKK